MRCSQIPDDSSVPGWFPPKLGSYSAIVLRPAATSAAYRIAEGMLNRLKGAKKDLPDASRGQRCLLLPINAGVDA